MLVLNMDKVTNNEVCVCGSNPTNGTSVHILSSELGISFWLQISAQKTNKNIEI